MAKTILAILGVAYAAVLIWLTVRIVNRKERWAKWMLAGTIVGPPMLYVLSFGPACWLNERTSKEFILTTGVPDPGSYWQGGIGTRVFLIAYKPFFKFAGQPPEWGWRSRLFRWYAEVGTRNASLEIFWRNDEISWYRPDFPPSMVMDETGTYVPNPRRADEIKP